MCKFQVVSEEITDARVGSFRISLSGRLTLSNVSFINLHTGLVAQPECRGHIHPTSAAVALIPPHEERGDNSAKQLSFHCSR